MADAETPQDDAPQKGSKLPLILGLVLALAGGGAGFYATWSGMILGAGDSNDAAEMRASNDTDTPALDNVTFVPVDPLVISVSARPDNRLLRFRAQLEVPSDHVDEVTKVLPRITDVLNSYLRALEVADIEDRTALTRLRAQMLRRVQVVTGQDRVNDFLIMEFVLT
ncbi:flagellar basal body-associated FliL family protein [Sulfitobacter albidus]|uniref:Flagellar protein FliL n=1 Tax=Sulfitobacter albidus TaxID=2829501 RepID=A0A975JD73_9RHOB|nr:flagellar basal body-associated FliL family protein [Sulfitobacter albidus]QUJ76306.1 flagellar basal body-associated FliL family protein [Sulfitobacter albidus]